MRIQVSREGGYGLLLEEGQLAGEYYRLNPLICTNPVCECKVISLHCFSRARDLPQPFAPTHICLEMDLAKRVVTNLKTLEADSTGYAFAKAVASEISDGDWAELWNLYLLVKQRQTEQADLDSLDIQFPPEVLAGDGSMVGYNEILPFAGRVVFPLGVDQWFFDDQYCVNPTCSCREAAISFFLVRPAQTREPQPIGPDLMLTRKDKSRPRRSQMPQVGQDIVSSRRLRTPGLISTPSWLSATVCYAACFGAPWVKRQAA